MKNKPAPFLVPSLPCEDDIRGYAYHLYEQSGRMLGHDLDNWLEAAACLFSNIPRHCSHRRLHMHLNEPQKGKVQSAPAGQSPGRPPSPARPPAKLAHRRK